MKWIGAFLGVLNGGVLGGIAGYAIGAFLESIFNSGDSQQANDNTSYNSTEAYDDQQYYDTDNGERNGFLFSMMVLAAHIIQADGKIMHSEMEMARQFLRTNFGEGAVQQGNDILLRMFDYRKQHGDQEWHNEIENACIDMRRLMPEEHRLQLVAFLAEIAKADGKIVADEVKELKWIAARLGLNTGVVEQMLAMGGDTLEDAYQVLGISPNATDDEVRRAYRKMALQYHPDRVATLGDDVKEAAQKKFQELNNAKERIFKSRNM